MANITIVGGAGAIGRVHAFLLAAKGHTVTILDSRPDGEPGSSYLNLTKATSFRFLFPEIIALQNALPESETLEDFRNRFKDFPEVFKTRVQQFTSQIDQPLSKKKSLEIIENIITLPRTSIKLAQSRQEILEPQDTIVVTVKGAALNEALGNKIKAIRQYEKTPVVVFANGIMPWTMPQLGFGGLRLKSIGNINAFVDCFPIEKMVGGVLIKYGAAPVDENTVCMRSCLFDARNIITATTLTGMYTDAGLTTTSTSNVMSVILDKLNYNLTGSIMGAIFNCKMGNLVRNEKIKNAVEECARELYNFAWTLDVHLAPTEDKFISNTINALKKNHDVISSPLQDIRAGRTTEKDFLVKATIEWAHKHDLNMPVLKSMYELMSMVEKTSCRNRWQGKKLQARLVELMEKGDIVSLAEQYNLAAEQYNSALVKKHVLAWMTKGNKKVSQPGVAASAPSATC